MVKFETLTVTNAVKVLTAATYAGARKAVIAVEGNSIRFTYDGTTNPTDTIGTPAAVNTYVELETLEQIKNFKAFVGAIASPIVTAKLSVHYENNDDGFRTE